ncbi:MAG: ABC transporter ATP-binding protein [Clostridia bacterium]|nr:ABC transporter ATP-binding protein [Clostridia bacterium]
MLSNKELSKQTTEYLEKNKSILGDAEYAVVGDLSVDGKYAYSAFVLTKTHVITFDGGTNVYDLNDIKKIQVKRMYGNAAVIIILNDDTEECVFRFTYSVAVICEALVDYINHVRDGADEDSEKEIIDNAFSKLLRVCPKCGRALMREGSECLKCKSKKSVYKKVSKYIKPELGRLLFCVAMSIITTITVLFPPMMTQKLIDEVIPEKNMNMLINIIFLLILSYIIQVFVAAYRSYCIRMSGDRIVLNIRNDVYEKAQKLPMDFYDKTSTGSIINRITNDSLTLQSFVLRFFQEAIAQAILMILIIVYMFSVHWKLALVALIPVPFIVFVRRKYGKYIAPYYRKIWRRWAAVTGILTDTIPCVRVIKSFTGEKKAYEKFKKFNFKWLKMEIKSFKIVVPFPHVINFLTACGSILIWAVGGTWVINSSDSNISLGLLVSFITYTSMFYTPVNFFATLNDEFQKALSSTERLLDIIDADPEANDGKCLKPEKIKGKIEFRNVSFSFDKGQKTLSDINLVINPGDIVGVVGTTGSGKTTLINLLQRYYDNYEGDILLDDINIKDIDLEYYRSKIGFVQQEPMMFSDTIFNNIAFGKPDATVEEVFEAADIANAHDFIMRQPDAYDSMLGERGIGLSGGEKQRVSIARAVLKNPEILIFDEATASVDSETEESIQSAIERLIKGRTTIMIAHRLSTLRKANVIIVIDNGNIIEKGSHEELMNLKGKYSKLIEIQSLSEKIIRKKAEENIRE